MVRYSEKIKGFLNDRWLVFVASMWVQSCSGIGYLFGSISPVIKSGMGYNQRQIALLGVAKDLGDAIGFLAGILCEILSIWAVLFIGVVQNFVGYGVVWMIVAHKLPSLPLWVVKPILSPSFSFVAFEIVIFICLVRFGYEIVTQLLVQCLEMFNSVRNYHPTDQVGVKPKEQERIRSYIRSMMSD